MFNKFLLVVKSRLNGSLVWSEFKNILLFFWYFIYSWFKKTKCHTSQKSVYFIGNNYNAFYTLCCALKKRGWRAFSLNPYEESSFIYNYDLYADLTDSKQAIKVFFDVFYNYDILHVYNRTKQSLYTGSSWALRFLLRVETLRLNKTIIMFTPSGCLDGSTTKEINEITGGLCNKCIWQNNPVVCNDLYNNKKINWISKNCDVFANEVDWDKALSKTKIGCSVPISSPIDSNVFFPGLSYPEEYKIPKNDEQIIILTAFGNEKSRANDLRDIKGKKYMVAAINQLIKEGFPIIHFHATEIPAKDMRYIQTQADIIIDQLNYGSIGSAAREGMMLGKPVVCHIAQRIRNVNLAMRDCPAVDATEETIYPVLKQLVMSTKEQRAVIGHKSREWMIKWFDASACAARYEKIYDNLKGGLGIPDFSSEMHS